MRIHTEEETHRVVATEREREKERERERERERLRACACARKGRIEGERFIVEMNERINQR